MAVKTLSVFLLFVAVCFAATPTTQLLNFLIANTNLGTNFANTYNALGLQAGTCTATAPAANTIPASIRLCAASTNVYPYNENGVRGLEVDLVAGFNATFRTQYPTTAYPFTWVTVNTANQFYNSLKAAVTAGTCDVILADIFQNSDRDLDFEKTCPYAQTRRAFARSFRNANYNVTSLNDLVTAASAGAIIRVGFVGGSVYATEANALPAAIEKLSFSTTAAGYVLLANNTIDAFLSDEATLIARSALTLCNNTNGASVQCTVTTYGTGASTLVAYSAYANGTQPVATTTTTGRGATTNNAVTTSTSAAASFSMVSVAVAALLAALMIIA